MDAKAVYAAAQTSPSRSRPQILKRNFYWHMRIVLLPSIITIQSGIKNRLQKPLEAIQDSNVYSAIRFINNDYTAEGHL